MSGDEGWKSPFVYSRLIICEGPDDCAFFNRFITVRGLLRCHVRHTGMGRHSAGGNTQFHEALRTARMNTEFSKIKRILLVSDNDNNPEKSFKNIQKQITAADFGTPPTADLARGAGNPWIMIMMIPLGGAIGTLESFCLQAARNKHIPTHNKIEHFATDVGAHNWDDIRSNKMKLRTSLAVRCERDPFISLQNVFGDPRYRASDLIPLMDNSFSPLEMALREFAR